MSRMITALKYTRLIIAIFMLVAIIAYSTIAQYISLPNLEQIVTVFISLFVFVLGLEYYIEKKMGIVSLFLMVFAIMMLVMTIIGLVL